MVHEARLRGIDATALPYDDSKAVFKQLSENFEKAWINPKTNKPPKPIVYKEKGFKQKIKALEKQCSSKGRYHIGLNWKDDDGVEYGHVLTAERLQNGKFRYFDPQIGTFVNITEYSIYDMTYLESIKVDKMLINIDVFKLICEAL